MKNMLFMWVKESSQNVNEIISKLKKLFNGNKKFVVVEKESLTNNVTIIRVDFSKLAYKQDLNGFIIIDKNILLKNEITKSLRDIAVAFDDILTLFCLCVFRDEALKKRFIVKVSYGHDDGAGSYIHKKAIKDKSELLSKNIIRGKLFSSSIDKLDEDIDKNYPLSRDEKGISFKPIDSKELIGDYLTITKYKSLSWQKKTNLIFGWVYLRDHSFAATINTWDDNVITKTVKKIMAEKGYKIISYGR